MSSVPTFAIPMTPKIIDHGLPQVVKIDQLESIAEGWSKWDIAKYVGAPMAFGIAGLWFYSRSKKKNKGEVKAEGGDSGVKSASSAATKPKQTSAAPTEPQSPQELAQAAKTNGNRLFKDCKYEEAIQCYTEAIKLCPPDVKQDISTFYQNRAAAYENMKQYDKVVEDCNSALTLNPQYSKALARRSKAYEVQEQYRKSLEDITKACLLEGFKNQPFLQTADRVLKSLGRFRATQEYKTKKPNKPSKFYVHNYLSGFVNDPVKLKFAPKVKDDLANMGVKVKDEPVIKEAEADEIGDNGAVLLEKPSAFERAKACLSTQEFQQIIPLCDEELMAEKSPFVAEALLLRGTMKLLQGMGDQAAMDLDRCGNMEGANPTVRATSLLRAASLQMQRNPEMSSLSKFDQAKQLDAGNSDIYYHHGQQLLQLEKLDEAINQFNKSIELSPKFPTSYVQKHYAIHRKAIMNEDMDMLTDAKKGFEKTLAMFPKCGDALILYAQALSDQGRFEDADKYFKKAADVQPQNANNIVHRGLMLLQWQGQMEQTVELLMEALKVDPTCQYAYEIWGTIEVQRGRLPEAVNYFKKAIALSNSESEMAHLFSLMEAAEVQVKVAGDLNIQLPSLGGADMA